MSGKKLAHNLFFIRHSCCVRSLAFGWCRSEEFDITHTHTHKSDHRASLCVYVAPGYSCFELIKSLPFQAQPETAIAQNQRNGRIGIKQLYMHLLFALVRHLDLCTQSEERSGRGQKEGMFRNSKHLSLTIVAWKWGSIYAVY